MSVQMRIAIEGCAHGGLEEIYGVVEGIARLEGKIDLLICCGDFQATRNLEDLQTMAVPPKYRDMGSFYKYYTGELVAPVLTIFIGGNHEASNYLQELPYGGWVAPNIYYMGYAGVVNVNGFRIGGISGIYKSMDYMRGRHECPPYNSSTLRSVYHIRNFDVFRLMQLSGDMDIFVSHDWPRGIYNYGNKEQLLQFKPHFREDIESGRLGGKPLEDLLFKLKPRFWFAAHLHCKFSALVPHNIDNDDDDDANANAAKADDKEEDGARTKPKPYKDCVTKFLALDKCVSSRRFLQLLVLEREVADPEKVTDEDEVIFKYDEEWLSILHNTNHLISVNESPHNNMPGPLYRGTERFDFKPTNEELQRTRGIFGDMTIPKNFCRIVPGFQPHVDLHKQNFEPIKPMINPQNVDFCDKLGIDDPLSLLLITKGIDLPYAKALESPVCHKNIFTDSTADLNFDLGQVAESNPLKRKSLQMPAVTNAAESTLSKDDETRPEKTKLLTQAEEEPSNTRNDDLLVETVSTVSISGAVVETEKEVDEEHAKDDVKEPTIPKLVRRNASIYQQDNNGSSSEEVDYPLGATPPKCMRRDTNYEEDRDDALSSEEADQYQ